MITVPHFVTLSPSYCHTESAAGGRMYLGVGWGSIIVAPPHPQILRLSSVHFTLTVKVFRPASLKMTSGVRFFVPEVLRMTGWRVHPFQT